MVATGKSEGGEREQQNNIVGWKPTIGIGLHFSLFPTSKCYQALHRYLQLFLF
jgi:hypothetical protein